MGTLAAYTTLGSKTGKVAYAQETRGPGKDTDRLRLCRSGASTSRPGPLGTVLDSFQSATGLQVMVPNEAMRTLSSPGVSGLYSVELALKQLLAGTGVSYRFTASETVTLEFQSLEPSVDVTERISPLSSLKYPEPLLDTPQSITIIPKKMIEQQGATTLRDVLRNVSGLTMTAGEGGTPAGDNLTLRGFSARNDIFIDGVRDLGPQSRDPFDLEQVEVVKGPGSAFSGRGSTGGTINLVSKSPSLNRFVDGTFMLGTDGTKRVTADLNVPVKLLGEHTAFRLQLPGARFRGCGSRRRQQSALGSGASLGVWSRHANPSDSQLFQIETGQHFGLRYSLGAGHQQCPGSLSRSAGAGASQHILWTRRSRP